MLRGIIALIANGIYSRSSGNEKDSEKDGKEQYNSEKGNNSNDIASKLVNFFGFGGNNQEKELPSPYSKY